MSCDCTCRSTRRDLAIIPPKDDGGEQFSPLAGEFGWTVESGAGVYRVPIGGSQKWDSAAEVANFLRTEFGSELLEAARGLILAVPRAPRPRGGPLSGVSLRQAAAATGRRAAVDSRGLSGGGRRLVLRRNIRY